MCRQFVLAIELRHIRDLSRIFIASGAALIENFAWILYVFAAFLILTGIQMLRTRNEHAHSERSRVLRLFKRFVPMTDAYYGQRFIVRKAGVLLATPLAARCPLHPDPRLARGRRYRHHGVGRRSCRMSSRCCVDERSARPKAQPTGAGGDPPPRGAHAGRTRDPA